MNLKLILATIVAVALVGAATPATTAAHSVSTVTYIGGWGSPPVWCQSPPNPGGLPGIGIGGGCSMNCPGGGTGCTVVASESDGTPGVFEWECDGTALTGSAVGVAQTPCQGHVTVSMSLGSFYGVITTG